MKIFSICLLGMCLGAGIVDFSNWYNPDEPPYLPSPDTAVLVLPVSKYSMITCGSIPNVTTYKSSVTCTTSGGDGLTPDINEITEN